MEIATAAPPDSSTEVLVESVKEAYGKVLRATNVALANAVMCGGELLRVKALIKHGAWQAYTANLGFDAALFMSLARLTKTEPRLLNFSIAISFLKENMPVFDYLIQKKQLFE